MIVGNWATPQTVTYLVNYYSDATFPPPTPSPSPTLTPAVPEFSLLAVIPLIVGLFVVAVVVKHRKTSNLRYGGTA
jgi:hypothetical protein